MSEQPKIVTFDQFSLQALAATSVSEEELFQQFLQHCLNELQRKISRLIKGETVYVIIPSSISKDIAERLVDEFNDAAGWQCTLNFTGEEPWIDFSKRI